MKKASCTVARIYIQSSCTLFLHPPINTIVPQLSLLSLNSMTISDFPRTREASSLFFHSRNKSTYLPVGSFLLQSAWTHMSHRHGVFPVNLSHADIWFLPDLISVSFLPSCLFFSNCQITIQM